MEGSVVVAVASFTAYNVWYLGLLYFSLPYHQSLINTEWCLPGDHINSLAHVSTIHIRRQRVVTKKPYLNNRKTSVCIFLLDIPKTKVRIKTDHLRPKEYHSMLAIFFKASLHILFLSYLTLNVVNSYMNNRYLECSSAARGLVRGGGGAFFLLLQHSGVYCGKTGRCRPQSTRPDVFKARSSRIMLRQEFISMRFILAIIVLQPGPFFYTFRIYLLLP